MPRSQETEVFPLSSADALITPQIGGGWTRGLIVVDDRRMDKFRPRGPRWLEWIRHTVLPLGSGVVHRVSGEPPHMSEVHSWIGPPPFLCM